MVKEKLTKDTNGVTYKKKEALKITLLSYFKVIIYFSIIDSTADLSISNGYVSDSSLRVRV